jgi:hypothetical protein
MLLRARRQLFSRSGGILREGGRFFALLSKQLCGIRGRRPRLLGPRRLLRRRLQAGLIAFGLLLKRQ